MLTNVFFICIFPKLICRPSGLDVQLLRLKFQTNPKTSFYWITAICFRATCYLDTVWSQLQDREVCVPPDFRVQGVRYKARLGHIFHCLVTWLMNSLSQVYFIKLEYLPALKSFLSILPCTYEEDATFLL